MTQETELKTADIVTLMIVKKKKKKKKKNSKFLFFKKENYFNLGKTLPVQTSNLAICLNIYISIFHMLTQNARVAVKRHDSFQH